MRPICGRCKPICGRCNVQMRCSKNGCVVRDPKVGECPSTYWHGDEFECRCCNAKVITNFGSGFIDPSEFDVENAVEVRR